MKAILRYGAYLNYGKQYQVKFVYENPEEIKTITNFIKNYSNRKKMNVTKSEHTKTRLAKPIDVIDKTNIPEHILPFLLKRFVNGYDAVLTIGNEKFKDSLDTDSQKYQDSIESLNKGRTTTRKQTQKKLFKLNFKQPFILINFISLF